LDRYLKRGIQAGRQKGIYRAQKENDWWISCQLNKTSFPVKAMVVNYHRERMLTHFPKKGGLKLFTHMMVGNRHFDGKDRLFSFARIGYDTRLA